MYVSHKLKTLLTGAALAMVFALSSADRADAITVNIAENLTLTQTVGPDSVQQTENSPCVIGGSSCNNPAGMGYTLIQSGGGSDYLDVWSPDYTVSLLRSIIGGDAFSIGIDVNQTNIDQILDTFVMTVNGVQTYAFDTVTVVPAPANGNGWSDYKLSSLSLAGLDDTDIVAFGMDMSLRNDGAEQFFLISEEQPPAPIPLPATGLLLVGALGGLAAARRRRKTA